MPAPAGTNVNLNIVMNKVGKLKRLLNRNSMADAKTLSTAILAHINTLNTAIQAATDNHDLSDSPTFTDPILDSSYQELSL